MPPRACRTADAGGLQVDTQALTRGWTHAEAPRSSTENGRTTVTINQTADRAILNWQTFNVGRDTTVDFRQQAEWAVLNRVNDPAGRPSQIQGQIKAPGTVLIVNRNGGVRRRQPGQCATWWRRPAGSATSSSAIAGCMAQGTEPSFTDALGKVEVRPGARIDTHAPGSVTQGGGYVLLLGSGAQRRRDQHAARAGAAAAGDSFIIRRGVGTSENTLSTTRGNEIAPRLAANQDGGLARNTGLIVAAEGDVTLAGRQVRQEGVALATTTTAHARHHPPAELGRRCQGQHRAGAGLGHGGADR